LKQKNIQMVFMVLLVFLLVTPIAYADYQDPLFEIVKGNVPGHSFFPIQGIDENVATTQYVIWGENTIYVYPPGPTQMNVSSSDVDDTNGGSGTWNVTIFGLDIHFTPIIETVTMNGQTPVPTVNQFYRINRMRIGRSGASEENEGMIYIGTGANVAGKPATIYNEIVTETGVSSTAIYTVPDGFTAYLKYFSLGTDTSKIIEVTLESRCIDCPDNSWSWDYHTHFDARTITHDDPLPFPYPEHSDIKITARNSVGGAYISADAFFILVEDGYNLINQSVTVTVPSEEPLDVNIVKSIDLMASGFTIFTIFAATLLYLGMISKIPGDRMMRFGVSFLFWIGSLSLWISDGGGFVPLLVLIAPTLISLVWTIQALGETTDYSTKKDIYSVY